jgi:hypothetical protein
MVTNLTGYDDLIGLLIAFLLVYGIGYCMGFRKGKTAVVKP